MIRTILVAALFFGLQDVRCHLPSSIPIPQRPSFVWISLLLSTRPSAFAPHTPPFSQKPRLSAFSPSSLGLRDAEWPARLSSFLSLSPLLFSSPSLSLPLPSLHYSLPFSSFPSSCPSSTTLPPPLPRVSFLLSDRSLSLPLSPSCPLPFLILSSSLLPPSCDQSFRRPSIAVQSPISLRCLSVSTFYKR